MSIAGGDSQPLFSPRTVIVLALVGVFAFAGFVALLAFSPDLLRDRDCRPNVYSSCAIGFAGLQKAVELAGEPTTVSRAALPRGSTEGLLVATPEPLGGSDIGGLGFSGPILVILPKWRAMPDLAHLGWGLKAGLIPPAAMPHTNVLDVVTVARRKGIARPKLAGAANSPFEGQTLAPGPIDSLQTLHANGWTPVLTDETGGVVMAEAASSRIFVLSDPDLLNTQGLKDADTFGVAERIVSALREGDGPIIFDLTLDGYKLDRSPLKLVLLPPFVGVTLCVLAAIALALWEGLFRFGPLRRPARAFALGKEGLVDNSAQLIRLARREAKMAPRYAALTRALAAKAVGAPHELTGEALTGFLDRVGQRNGGDNLATLVAEADRVRDRAGLTQIARRLYLWRRELTHGRP